MKKQERIGACVAGMKDKTRKENTCAACGEMPCSGIECLTDRLDALESDVKDVQCSGIECLTDRLDALESDVKDVQRDVSDVQVEVESGGRW